MATFMAVGISLERPVATVNSLCGSGLLFFIHSLKQILLVEVWFDLRKGGRICLPRITQPEAAQKLILHHLGWSLPEQPPPTIYRDQNNFVWTT